MPTPPSKKTLDQLAETEISAEFIEYMKNRMLTSHFKYGPVRRSYPKKIDALACARQRINKYLTTHNKEWLVDAANFLMIEFMCPQFDNAHFRATDSDESPGLIEREEIV